MPTTRSRSTRSSSSSSNDVGTNEITDKKKRKTIVDDDDPSSVEASKKTKKSNPKRVLKKSKTTTTKATATDGSAKKETASTQSTKKPTARKTTGKSDTSHHDAKIAKMTFGAVYPHYVTKVEKKGRTKDELHQAISWLTGVDESIWHEKWMMDEKITFETMFSLDSGYAKLPPTASLITGTICCYRVENITNPITQRVRYLDKVVDELAKGRPLEKILRK